MTPFDAALYIHIPFCSRKCDYCDFFSVTDYSLSGEVIRRIAGQAAQETERYGIRRFETVYLGGGTPGSLETGQIRRLLEEIRRIGGGELPHEVTLECNPENITEGKLADWSAAGVSRISLGIQTFQDRFLKLAGRNSSRDRIVRALDILGDRQDLALSLDLIQGLPGMGREDQLRDLAEAAARKPEHVSWYTLTLEEGTVLHDQWEKRRGAVLTGEEAERVWQEGCRLLEREGYGRYEVSNFARPGERCGHNMAYWEMRPFLGCGPGAVSMLPEPEGGVSRFRRAPDAAVFARGEFGSCDREKIGPRDFLKDFLLMGLRVTDGIDLGRFARIFGVPAEDVFPGTLDSFGKSGHLTLRGGRLAASGAGLDILNTILIALFEEVDGRKTGLNLCWPG